jgi:hypothetical protein
MTAHAKSFAASRRSILKGLGAAAIGISLSGKTRRAFAEEADADCGGAETLKKGAA